MADFEKLLKENMQAYNNAAYYYAVNKIDDAIAVLELQAELAQRELKDVRKRIFDYSNDFELFLFAPEDEIAKQKASEKEPVKIQLWPIYNFLGILYTKKKYFEEAKRAALEAMVLDPFAAEPYLTVANLDIRQKHFDEALETLAMVKDVAYSLGDVCAYYHCWGLYFKTRKQIPEAILAYEAALAYDLQPEKTRAIIAKILAESIAMCSDDQYFLSADLTPYDIATDPLNFTAVKLAYLAAQQAIIDNKKSLALFLLRVSNTIMQRDDVGDCIRSLWEELEKEEQEDS